MQMKRLFNYKNTKFDQELASIPHNFSVAHDNEKNVTELTIYGVIGESWYSDSYTTALDVDTALNEANGKDILIRLNSQGGNAFDGISIFNRLMAYKNEHGAKISVSVDGYACSAASLIPLAADDVTMGVGSMLMIHEASVGVWGTKETLRGQADLLEKLEEGIIDIYETKANMSRDELREKVNAETWFNAKEAVELGFATHAVSRKNDDSDVVNALVNQVEMLTGELEKLKNNIQKEESTQVEVTKPTTNKRLRFLF